MNDVVIDDEFFEEEPRNESEESTPVVVPKVEPPPIDDKPIKPTDPSKISFTTILIIGLLVMWFLSMQRGGCTPVIPSPDDSVVIDEEGSYVLLLSDLTEEGQEKLSEGQASAISSTKIPIWCKENGFLFKSEDYRQDLSGIEPIWGQLQEKAKDPPSITVLKDSKARTTTLPDGIEPTLDFLESAK